MGDPIVKIEDVVWRKLRSVRDERGSLTAIEGALDIPFEIERVFYMHDIAPGSDRGGHAHRDTDQLAVAVHGTVHLRVSDGRSARLILLDDPTWGLLLPRMTWTRLMHFSPGAVCVVLASTHYDMSQSIRSWGAYLAERGYPDGAEPTTGPHLMRPVVDRP